ncbi:hypothetical protein [Arthrobacter sp. NPDC056727]|uniref:hypothetical protein n=1 Tax=Arthrobacter sp. NPDC056727 TaxID=3345927 RepID=UPI00366AFBEA
MSTGGTNAVCRAEALIVSALLAISMAACSYEDDIEGQLTAAGPKSRPAPSLPTKDREVLSAEATNFAELKKRLAAATGSVLIDDSGPADGPGVGFRKSATVKVSGAYRITAACVGIDGVQMLLDKDPGTGAEPISLTVDCSEVLSQVVELQAGYVGVSLIRNDPTGPWTGAVAGIKIAR